MAYYRYGHLSDFGENILWLSTSQTFGLLNPLFLSPHIFAERLKSFTGLSNF